MSTEKTEDIQAEQANRVVNYKTSVGESDFKALINSRRLYVDKTFLIEDICENSNKVILFTRPRRFGKSLTISMLRYFFEKSEEDLSYLFEHHYIWKTAYKKEFGQYPVICINLKDVSGDSWSEFLFGMQEQIKDECARHPELLNSPFLDESEKEWLQLYKQMPMANINERPLKDTRSLLNLMICLHKHYNKQVVVLIDEYDAPVHKAFMSDCYEEVIKFFRSWLSPALKDQSMLKLGVMTGILRVTKESILSPLNNIEVASLLSCDLLGAKPNKFATSFGFTEAEVEWLWKKTPNTTVSLADIKEWYNGYRFGKHEIYNPWSVLSCLDVGGLDNHWCNTGGTEIVKDLIRKGDDSLKMDFEDLIRGSVIEKDLQEGLIFPDMENYDERAVWGLLLHAGYVTSVRSRRSGSYITYDLKIPNRDVCTAFDFLVSDAMIKSNKGKNLRSFFKYLEMRDFKTFATALTEFVAGAFSFFDIKKTQPESFYHAFVLGIVAELRDTYQIRSNRESGSGRYDIALIPNNKAMKGIIFEFKKVNNKTAKVLQAGAEEALQQIKDKNYKTDITWQGINKIILVGMAFCGKDCRIEITEQQI